MTADTSKKMYGGQPTKSQSASAKSNATPKKPMRVVKSPPNPGSLPIEAVRRVVAEAIRAHKK